MSKEGKNVSQRRSSKQRLQGSARVVSDHCADWNNYIQRWDELNEDGFHIARNIVNIKLQQQQKSQQSESLQQIHESRGDSTQIVEGESVYPEGLEELCSKFIDVFTSMVHIVNQMTNITAHFEGVHKLEQSKSADVTSPPLFQSWTLDEFCLISRQLETMYRQDIKLKQSVVEDIAHQTSRDVLMTYMAMWLHQPYLEDRQHLLLQSMLLETGWTEPS